MDLKAPKVTIELLGIEYKFFLSLAGADELREKYGSTPAALKKLMELYELPVVFRDINGSIDIEKSQEVQRIRGEEMDKWGRDLILDFVHACIIHNAFNEDGEPIPDFKIPSIKLMKNKLGLKDIQEFFLKLSDALAASTGTAKEGELVGETPTPIAN